MPLYESPAVVLRQMKLGEADKIVTFFTLRFGKIKAVAKGSKRPKSKFSGRLEPFTYLKVILFGKEKTDLMRLNSCDVLDPFLTIRDDFNRLNRAFVSAELVDFGQKASDPNTEGFNLLLALWRGLCLESDVKKQNLILRLFELKYMSSIGYRPSLDKCVACQRDIEPPSAGFNALRGGAICNKCIASDPAASRISVGAVRLMSKGLTMPVEMFARLKASPEALVEIEKSVADFVRTHIHRDLKSERFLKI